MVSDIIRPADDDDWLPEPCLLCADDPAAVAALDRLVNERTELEAIVRDLAAEEEPVADIAPEYGDYVCMVCPEGDDDSPGVVHVREDYLHAARCAWLRSRKWVAAHPVPGDQP